MANSDCNTDKRSLKPPFSSTYLSSSARVEFSIRYYMIIEKFYDKNDHFLPKISHIQPLASPPPRRAIIAVL